MTTQNRRRNKPSWKGDVNISYPAGVRATFVSPADNDLQVIGTRGLALIRCVEFLQRWKRDNACVTEPKAQYLAPCRGTEDAWKWK